MVGGRRRSRDAGSVRFSERDGWVLGLVGEQYVISDQRSARSCDRSKSSHWGWLRNRWCPGGLGGEQATDSYRARRSLQEARVDRYPAVADVRILLERELRFGERECACAVARKPRLARRDQINNTTGASSLNQETRPREICVMITVQVDHSSVAGQSGRRAPGRRAPGRRAQRRYFRPTSGPLQAPLPS